MRPNPGPAMKIARFYAPGDIRVEDAPRKPAGLREVELRVRSCSVCATDLEVYRYGHRRIAAPRVLGHEIAGEVVALGEGVAGWSPGDRAQVIGAIPCGRCADCRGGRMSACQHQESMGCQYDGGLAEYLTVPAQVLAVGGLNPIPEGVTFAEASLAEPLACVLNGQELAEVGTGDEVVVVGSGPLGCLHVRLARSRGAARVLLVETDEARLEHAAALVHPDEAIHGRSGDLVEAVLKHTDGRGADVVITATPLLLARAQALQMTAHRGRISCFGFDSHGSSPAQNARALDLIADGDVPVADLIGRRVPLDEVLGALDAVRRHETAKSIIEPSP